MNEMLKQMNEDRVIIVCGPPGAGKSTYAKQNRQRGDIIIDTDYLSAALMCSESITGNSSEVLSTAVYAWNAIIDAIAENKITFARAFIITVTDAWKIQSRTGGRIVKLDPGINETLRRIDEDKTRSAEQNRLRKDQALKYYYTRGGKNV